MAFGEETIQEVKSRIEALMREYTSKLSKAMDDQNGQLKIDFKVKVEEKGMDRDAKINTVEIKMKFKPTGDVEDTSSGQFREPIVLRKE